MHICVTWDALLSGREHTTQDLVHLLDTEVLYAIVLALFIIYFSPFRVR